MEMYEIIIYRAITIVIICIGMWSFWSLELCYRKLENTK